MKAVEGFSTKGNAERKYGALDKFVCCEECGCVVPDYDIERKLHGEWHERLRRAVDETEMLG